MDQRLRKIRGALENLIPEANDMADESEQLSEQFHSNCQALEDLLGDAHKLADELIERFVKE